MRSALCLRLAVCAFLLSSNKYLPKSIIRQTGGAAIWRDLYQVQTTFFTRQLQLPRASDITPACSPSASITLYFGQLSNLFVAPNTRFVAAIPEILVTKTIPAVAKPYAAAVHGAGREFYSCNQPETSPEIADIARNIALNSVAVWLQADD